jgi:hypothetical protein
MIFDPVVTIPKPIWGRIEMLVKELAYMRNDDELNGFQLERSCEEFVRRIVDEYIRQYFEESTRAAAELVHKRRVLKERRELDY